jgi:hypothetical protein
MAIILPLIVLLLLMAIDFGRVFFGWVAMHNAARIGADYAAGNAGAWDGMLPGHQSDRDEFEEIVLNDLQSLNCTLPSPDPLPEPIFASDLDGDGSNFSDGDLVQVNVRCAFGLLTPLAEGLFGGPIDVGVRTEFAIYRTLLAEIGDPGPPPPGACDPPGAAFTTDPAPSAGRVNIASGQSVTFTDTSTDTAGCEITEWEWDFGDGNTDTTAGPVTHTYVFLGPQPQKNFTAELTVAGPGGTDSESITVRVAAP